MTARNGKRGVDRIRGLVKRMVLTLGARQRGVTLVVGLVMLVVLTLLVLSAIRSTSTNLRITSNMQTQGEIAAAAQQATEQFISSNFTTAPAASSVAVDINNDGVADYTANVAIPTCKGSTAVLNANLDVNNAADTPCISSGAASNTGLMSASAPAAAGVSWCYLQKWEVQAQATDDRTGATATLHQGVSMRVPAGTTCD